ncbi:MAG: response regulator [Desulfobacterales bacterium]|nr:response regulator [Desulfobacterales bacterium]
MTKEQNKEFFSILIVDDEPKNIQLLGNLLEENGYGIEFAMDGEGAIKWLEKKNFDLILLDIMMPGMDGFELCEKIKTNISLMHIPIIFLTAKTDTEDILKAFEMGGSDYVTKPFRPLELLARVKQQVEMKTLRGLIPICANCKSIRDDKGAWSQIEAYIQEHSAALFSHGMCPTCMEQLYGEQDWFKNKFKASQ